MPNRINVNVVGTTYTVVTDESEEYISKIAKDVDKRMREVLRENDKASITMSAVMAAFDLCDALYKTDETAENMRTQIKDYMSYMAKAKAESEESRREISKLMNEISDLRQRLRAGR